MLQINNDLALVESIQSGELHVFNLLVSKYQNRLTQIIQSYVKNEHDAAEICQEVFIKAYKAIHKFRGDSSFYTWIYRIAINCSKNFLRSKKSCMQLADNERDDSCIQNIATSNHNPEHLTQSDQVIDAIQQAMHQLSPELQQVIQLREVEGLSYDEIAEQVQCPVGTVRSRIFRARSFIDQYIAPLLEQHTTRTGRT
tara:strand:- start:572 stop:1165 length:594 start_codon:yes stop_codon:yes gene_type:complete